MDSVTKLQELKDKVQKFCEDRDWDQYHNPKELAVGLIIEAAELLEHFRFKSEQEMHDLIASPQKKEEISDEMADILYFLLRLAQKYNIDLSEALYQKMDKSEKKYPIEKARGSNKKYTEL